MRNRILVIAASFLSACLWLLLNGGTINGDEAIVGLMALKISQGADFPVFFWKAHYSGPFASYLLAPFHLIWEPSGILLHSILVPLHVCYVFGMYLLARRWLDETTSLFAALFAALPATLFPFSPLGGYTESLTLVPWIALLISTVRPEAESDPGNRWRLLGAGFLMGFALWIFPIVVPAVVVCLYLLFRHFHRRAIVTALAGTALALLPTILYNIAQPGATLLRLGSRPSGLGKAEVASIVESEGTVQLLVQVLTRCFRASTETLLSLPQFTMALFGLDHPSSIFETLSGIVGLAGLFAGAWFFLRDKGPHCHLVRALGYMVIANYAFVILFGMNRPRYLIPLLIIVPFGLAVMRSRLLNHTKQGIVAGIVASVLLINGLSNFLTPALAPSHHAALGSFLEEHALSTGYAGYFTAYPLNYLSDERLVFTPAFHQPQFDRYPPYTTHVAKSEAPAFIFDNDIHGDAFRARLSGLGVRWDETRQHPYTVFSNLDPMPEFSELRIGYR